MQCSYESKVKTGLTDHLINSYKVSYRADLESYEDLIRLSVRRFLSQISSSQSHQLDSGSEFVSSRTTRQLIRYLAITITMANVTVIRRSEQTDVTGKLEIENILEEMKEAAPGIWHWQSCDFCCLQSRGLPISSKDVPE